MNKTSGSPEFVKTIEDIHGAEQQYDRIISDAKKEAETVIRQAKEKTHQEREETEKEIVNYKNEKIRSGSKEIEKKVTDMLKKAGNEASNIKKKKLEKKEVSKLVKEFLGSL
ncbi:hypothetical protein GF318_03420 [Candidatus Micrarchaeota archaeon]|nr:hypothetical protein [Candidatus Micrarchaeota archaeon]